MKIPIMCPICPPPLFEFTSAHITNKLQVTGTCKKGHNFTASLQTEKFIVFFDAACEALLNNYYSEAVFNVASSIERYHEFFLRITLLKTLSKNEDVEIQLELFEKMWKGNLDNRSERQLGAFYFYYFSILKKPPSDFVLKNTNFRNRVIHKGHIPEKNETWEYIQGAYSYISEGVAFLKQNYGEECHKLTLRTFLKSSSTGCVCASLASMINLISEEEIPLKFEEALLRFQTINTKLREMMTYLDKQSDDEKLDLFINQIEEQKTATYKMHYDAITGVVLGQYPSIIDYPTIPEPHITIDYEQWRKFNDSQQNYKVDLMKKVLVYI